MCVCVFVCFFFQDGFKRFPKMWSLWSCLHLDDLPSKPPGLAVTSQSFLSYPSALGEPETLERNVVVFVCRVFLQLGWSGWSLDFHLGWVLNHFMPFHGYIYWASPGNADTEDWPCDWRGWVLGKWWSWWCFFFPRNSTEKLLSDRLIHSIVICYAWDDPNLLPLGKVKKLWTATMAHLFFWFTMISRQYVIHDVR